MKFEILDEKNKVIGTESIITLDISKDLHSHNLHEYNRFVRNKFRVSTASTQSRSEVSVTGAKPYKQKGTGNARRGRNSSPLRRGGAVAFGPKPRSFSFKLNKKSLIRSKNILFDLAQNNIKILKPDFKINKTKEAYNFTEQYTSNVLIYCTYDDIDSLRSFQNLPNVIIDIVYYIDPELLISSEITFLTISAFEHIKRSIS